ncbi:MAG: helix-turn-helix domain-containing protein [Ruminococcus sp.]|nr:helix-turn-helix domain-containing protein [Ruminococcus sp.]
MIYRERIIQLRERNGNTQKEIADRINMDSSHYRHCEKEDELFPIKHLNNICNFFNISFDYVFSFTNTKQYHNNNYDINIIKAGERLKEFRKENNLTQDKLANYLNTVHQVISRYEKGINIISTPFLYDICKKYHISADYLLGKVDNPKYLK